MAIESLEQVYEHIEKSGELNDASISFLKIFFDNHPFTQAKKALIIAGEKMQIEDKKQPLLSACINNLDRLSDQYAQGQKDSYHLVKSFFKALIEILPFELLNKPHKPFIGNLVGKKNAFTLAVDHMANLYRSFYEKKEYHFSDLRNGWFEDICKPLMTKKIDVDVGRRIFGHSNLRRCWQYNLPQLEDDPLTIISNYIFKKTKNRNDVDTLGQTILYSAIIRNFPVECMKPLIEGGLDVNQRCLESAFSGGSVRIPLLTHCIKLKNYVALEMLLECGADPNAMPEKGKSFFSSDMHNESYITPYQFAVAMDDEKAVECFINHSKKTGIPLISEMEEGATFWQNNLGNLKLKKKGTPLVLACKNRLFRSESNILKELFDDFGIRCYVSNPEDRKNVSEGLRWLATDAFDTPVAEIWKPVFECLMEQMKSNPHFALYVSSIPSEYAKSKFCQGLMCENIYVESGLSADRYKVIIAHEAAHLFDNKKIHINRHRFQYGESAAQFAGALERDFEELSKRSQASATLHFAKLIKSSYEEMYNCQPFKEYFAYLLVSEVFSRYLNGNGKADEEDALEQLKDELPETFAWYSKCFM